MSAPHLEQELARDTRPASGPRAESREDPRARPRPRKRPPDPALAVVLVLGLALRAVLIPLGHGEDFIVWDKSSAALLRGTNFYAHHPGYPHGPFAYFPLFVYLELPFRWLAMHSVVPFTILGKLPSAAGDVACAVLIAAELRRHGTTSRRAAAGAALYFLNPLVLYNSAYYGRFDTLGCALLLVALRAIDLKATSSRAVALWYGLAIAAKTFPGFLLPGVLRQVGGRRSRVLLGTGIVVAAVSFPFLTTPGPFFHDLVLHDITKTPVGLSWQYLLRAPLGDRGAKLLSDALLLVFVIGAVRLRGIRDPRWYVTITLVLFMLCSKVALEQYLTWAMPWLILIGLTAVDRAGRGCLAVLAVFTAIGMIDNESWHPLGRSSWPVAGVFAGVCLAHLASGIRSQRRSPRPIRVAGGPSRTPAPRRTSSAAPHRAAARRRT